MGRPGEATRAGNGFAVLTGETSSGEGLGIVGTGGGSAQVWSPNSERGTGWLQLEHLTVGRTCEIRVGWFADDGTSREAIVTLKKSEVRSDFVKRPGCKLVQGQGMTRGGVVG